jgi:hypothetical protein
MSEKQRPNIVGKGRSLARDAIAAIGALKEASKLGAGAMDKIGSLLTERASMWESILKMPFIGTVKAGEMSWDLSEAANELKAAAAAGDEAKSSSSPTTSPRRWTSAATRRRPSSSA